MQAHGPIWRIPGPRFWPKKETDQLIAGRPGARWLFMGMKRKREALQVDHPFLPLRELRRDTSWNLEIVGLGRDVIGPYSRD